MIAVSAIRLVIVFVAVIFVCIQAKAFSKSKSIDSETLTTAVVATPACLGLSFVNVLNAIA